MAATTFEDEPSEIHFDNLVAKPGVEHWVLVMNETDSPIRELQISPVTSAGVSWRIVTE